MRRWKNDEEILDEYLESLPDEEVQQFVKDYYKGSLERMIRALGVYFVKCFFMGLIFFAGVGLVHLLLGD